MHSDRFDKKRTPGIVSGLQATFGHDPSKTIGYTAMDMGVSQFLNKQRLYVGIYLVSTMHDAKPLILHLNPLRTT